MKISENSSLKNSEKHIALGLYLLLTALPLLAGIVYALLTSVGLTGALSQGFTLSHWQWALESTEVWKSITFSMYIATMALAIAMCLAFFLVIYLRPQLEKGWLSRAIYMPLAIPAAVAAFFSFQMLSASGLLARFFYQLGWINSIHQFPELINDAWGIGIILTHALMAFPFLTLVLLNLYESKGILALSELASTLGARSVDIRVKVVFPILFKGIMPTLGLFFLFILGAYEIPLLLGRQDPQMITLLTLRKLQRFDLSVIPQAYVVALIYIALVLMVMLWGLKGKKIRAYAD